MLSWLRRKRSRPGTVDAPVQNDIRLIANADLTENDFPSATDGWGPPGIQAFALSFNGFQHWGSFQKCAEVASDPWTKSLDNLTMTELRTTLFFIQRAVRHCEEELSPSELLRIRAIVDAIRDRVRSREIT